MSPYCNSMILPDRILFGSLFAFTELLQKKIFAVTFNVFPKTLSTDNGKVLHGRINTL